jgi:hypothetical protein
MWDWLRGHTERRKNISHRLERERDKRIQRELDEGVQERQKRTVTLIGELRRLEQDLHRDGQ